MALHMLRPFTCINCLTCNPILLIESAVSRTLQNSQHSSVPSRDSPLVEAFPGTVQSESEWLAMANVTISLLSLVHPPAGLKVRRRPRRTIQPVNWPPLSGALLPTEEASPCVVSLSWSHRCSHPLPDMHVAKIAILTFPNCRTVINYRGAYRNSLARRT